MEIASQVELENELRLMGAEQLRRERLQIANELKSLQEQIGDLAFNNYRTYADAGRTTQHCTQIFTEMSEKLREVSGEVGGLSTQLRSFQAASSKLSKELETIRAATEKTNPLWEVISLPSRMDVCIRAGYYEAAYSLTNYGMVLQQHSMAKNALIKNIAGRLVESRSFLLEELFNKFAGPLDLAASIQVVNKVRKMPSLTPTQLRVSVLQHRDVYLDKQILDIGTHPDLALKAIEIYRDCMYDSLVLYLAVFPENEVVRRDASIDPRWEPWPSSAPSAVLGQWAARNISRLLDLIHRTDMKSGVDMCAVWSKMMSMGASFGRMGLDFRPTILSSLSHMVLDRFHHSVRQATNRLVNDVKVLSVASGDIGSLPFTSSSADSPPTPSAEISMWDDICVYGNEILEAMNNMRYSLSPVLVSGVISAVRESLSAVLSWLSSHHSSPHFPRALRILCLHLSPFLANSLRFLFPFSIVSRLFGSTITKHQYDNLTELDMRELSASSDGAAKIEEILLPLLHKKTLADIDLDAVMRKDNKTGDMVPPSEETTQLISQHVELIEEDVQPSTVKFGLFEQKEDRSTSIELPCASSENKDEEEVIAKQDEEGWGEDTEWGWQNDDTTKEH